MKRIILLMVSGLCLSLAAWSQAKWDLERCVTYAVANNISVKQADIQAKMSELTLKQSKLNQYPSLNVSANTAINGGRSIDPTTNLFTVQQILSAGVGLQTGMTLFNWFSIKNTIAGNQFAAEAASANIEKIKNDISLNVATAYLLVLVAKEQSNIAKVSIQQTLQNLENTSKRVDAGTLPELNKLEIEAQLARDSSAYITAEANVIQNTLQLKALLNLDAAEPFEVEMPPLEQIPIEKLSDLQPENVFALAQANLPQQKIINLRIKASEKYAASARGQMYPTFSMFGGLGSNYSNFKSPVDLISTPTGNYQTTGAKVSVNGADYFVQTPEFTNTVVTGRSPFWTQMSDNFRQNIGIGLNVPIFNNGLQKTAWKRSLLDVKNLELQKELDTRTLKQDIYRAHNDATAAIQKYNANKKSVETAEKAFNYSQKRYDLGLLSTIDFITTQNTLSRTRVELVQAHVDYVFRMKLLEFYKGQGIRLK